MILIEELRMEEYIVEVSGLSFRYDRKNVLEQIDLNIPKGAFLGIIGRTVPENQPC